MADNNSVKPLSLLWPKNGRGNTDRALLPQVIRDLALESIVVGMCSHSPHQDSIRKVIFQLNQDPAVLEFRQAIMHDLLRQPVMVEALKSIIPLLDELVLFSHPQFTDESSLHRVIHRAGELELLVDCVHLLDEAFKEADGELHSQGLLGLKEYVNRFMAEEEFKQVVSNLPRILSNLRACRSVTVGVNLDERLQPEEAVLLSANPDRFNEDNLLNRLLGKSAAGGKGIAPVHTLPMITEKSEMITGGLPISGPTRQAEPMMVPLFRDLSQVLEKTTKPVARELRQYVHLNSQFLRNLRPEIIFYVQAISLAERMKSSGLPICLPEIAPREERIFKAEDIYNIQLSLHLRGQEPASEVSCKVVTNNVPLSNDERIVILTGPNQGGKTTYMQAIGQAQVMAQAGLFVPARSACISPVDGVFTHYPVEERLELGTGRFGDEARRLRAIFEQVTRHSLVLLNESLATTNMGESLYLAQNIIQLLQRIGLRAIFTTHQHELAESVKELNNNLPHGSQVVSMVASYEGKRREREADAAEDVPYSYRVEKSSPLGRSFADRIATRYGIGHAQLEKLLNQRGVLGWERAE